MRRALTAGIVGVAALVSTAVSHHGRRVDPRGEAEEGNRRALAAEQRLGAKALAAEPVASALAPGLDSERVFPYGDYFELAVDSASLTQAIWGEGVSYE